MSSRHIKLAVSLLTLFGVTALVSSASAETPQSQAWAPKAAVQLAQSTVIIAPNAPPPPRVETIPPPPSVEAQVMYWRPGRWAWAGGNWQWTPGEYVQRPAPQAVWEPGHWTPQPNGGYVWVDGQWRG